MTFHPNFNLVIQLHVEIVFLDTMSYQQKQNGDVFNI